MKLGLRIGPDIVNRKIGAATFLFGREPDTNGKFERAVNNDSSREAKGGASLIYGRRNEVGAPSVRSVPIMIFAMTGSEARVSPNPIPALTSKRPTLKSTTP